MPPNERPGPGLEENEAIRRMLSDAATAPALINEYEAFVGAAGSDGEGLRPVIFLRLIGRVNKGTDMVSHLSLWSLEDAAEFAHMLLEQVHLATAAGKPETWNKHRRP